MPRCSAAGSVSAPPRWRRCAPRALCRGACSAPLVSPIARGDVDLVHPFKAFLYGTVDRAVMVFDGDPRDLEHEFFATAAERHADRIADRDARRQTNVVVLVAGAGDEPIAAFSEHTGSARRDRFDNRGLISHGRRARPG